MGELFDRYQGDVIVGKDITIGSIFPEIYVSERDEVLCYAGICLNDEELRNRASFMHPYYMVGKHSTDKKISKQIKQFYRIVEGCIVLDNYVDNCFWKDRKYKKIDAAVRWPMPDTYFGVWVDQVEDRELTRAIFGLTYNELSKLVEVYAKILGTYTDFFQYPKLTRSTRSVNYCDMTDVWIPEKFPYIAFNESGYEFSHISLWGFYRHVQLLTGCKLNSVISRSFQNAGLDEAVLNRLFRIESMFYLQTKVTKELWK